ncbi:MAG TPA: hypothetical protein VJ891_14360 [Casimicrobiaceae bacterium]|nr:hypothetical protein [Casimicrobiaceae bacterium]
MKRHVDAGFALADALVDANACRSDRALSQTRALFDDRNLGLRADRCNAGGADVFPCSCLSQARRFSERSFLRARRRTIPRET